MLNKIIKTSRRLFFLVLVLFCGVLTLVQPALAANNVLMPASAISMLDTNVNGKMDKMKIRIDNDAAVTAKIWDNTGWAVTDGGSAVTVSSVQFDTNADDIGDSATSNTDPLIIFVALDESDSDLTIDTANSDLEVSYTQQGANAGTEYNDGANTQLVAIATGDAGPTTEIDAAKPQIKTFTYKDTEATPDGKIDTMTVTFTETVTAASVLHAND